MARNYAALPHEYLEEMVALNDAEFGRLTRALLEYSRTGEPIALGGNERFYSARVMMQEDRFQESYDDLSEKRRAAGMAGGRPKKQAEASESKKSKAKQAEASESKKSKAKQAEASESKKTYTKTDTKTDTNTDTLLSPNGESESIARAQDFPPTIPAIRAYAKEIGSTVSPKQFADYYAATSWRIRGEQITDWKALFRRWTKREETTHGRTEDPAPEFGICL